MFFITSFAIEGLLLQFLSAFAAGFFVTLTVSPFDKCRTLLMNQTDDEFKGLPDCFMHILKKEGVAGLYKGCIPAWTRIAPNTVL
jgi:hypothetical protein